MNSLGNYLDLTYKFLCVGVNNFCFGFTTKYANETSAQNHLPFKWNNEFDISFSPSPRTYAPLNSACSSSTETNIQQINLSPYGTRDKIIYYVCAQTWINFHKAPIISGICLRQIYSGRWYKRSKMKLRWSAEAKKYCDDAERCLFGLWQQLMDGSSHVCDDICHRAEYKCYIWHENPCVVNSVPVSWLYVCIPPFRLRSND